MLSLVLALIITTASARDLTLPDPKLTPGVATSMTADIICKTVWGRDERHVTEEMKQSVFEAYGLTGDNDPACKKDSHGRRCEVDHLISRELGGADDVRNLWPQPYGTKPWNATRKDRVENRLHVEVCAGRLTLEQAQEQIGTDYRIPYVKYFGQP